MSATAFLFDRSCLGPGGPFSVLIAQSSALIVESPCPPAPAHSVGMPLRVPIALSSALII